MGISTGKVGVIVWKQQAYFVRVEQFRLVTDTVAYANGLIEMELEEAQSSRAEGEEEFAQNAEKSAEAYRRWLQDGVIFYADSPAFTLRLAMGILVVNKDNLTAYVESLLTQYCTEHVGQPVFMFDFDTLRFYGTETMWLPLQFSSKDIRVAIETEPRLLLRVAEFFVKTEREHRRKPLM